MGSAKARYWFSSIEKLLDQEVSLGHHSTSSKGQPEEEANPKATLQKEGVLSKVLDVRHEVESSSWMQVPARLFAGAGSVQVWVRSICQRAISGSPKSQTNQNIDWWSALWGLWHGQAIHIRIWRVQFGIPTNKQSNIEEMQGNRESVQDSQLPMLRPQHRARQSSSCGQGQDRDSPIQQLVSTHEWSNANVWWAGFTSRLHDKWRPQCSIQVLARIGPNKLPRGILARPGRRV